MDGLQWKALYIKMDDLGVPLFLETPICFNGCFLVISTWFLLFIGFIMEGFPIRNKMAQPHPSPPL